MTTARREGGTRPLRVGVLLSGEGTSFENLCEHIDAGAVPAQVAVVIASKATASPLTVSRRFSRFQALILAMRLMVEPPKRAWPRHVDCRPRPRYSAPLQMTRSRAPRSSAV